MSGYYICILLYCTVPHYDVCISYLYTTELYLIMMSGYYICIVLYCTVPHYDVWISVVLAVLGLLWYAI